jgi:hypothetical protein
VLRFEFFQFLFTFLWRFVMRVTAFGSAMLASALGLCMVGTAEAGAITAAPTATFTTADSSKDIVLTQAAPTWSADLSTYSNFLSNVYTVTGYDTNGGTGDGWGDVSYQAGPTNSIGGDDAPVPYAMVGSQYDGNLGGFIYKFVVAPGYKTTTGGTVSANVYYRGDPSYTTFWLGVSKTLTLESHLENITNPNDFDKKTAADLFSGDWGTYNQDPVTFSIPADATEFYVAVTDGGSGARLAISSLNVNANLVAVPEPAELSLLVLGGAACIRRRRR